MVASWDTSQKDLLIQLYTEYTDSFKPLLADVEAKTQELPAGVLNEIRAFVDHISRCYWPQAESADIDQNLERARGHLKRAMLDCMKHLLVSYREDIERFHHDYRNVDLTTVRDGDFYIRFKKMDKISVVKTRAAKKQETRAADDEVFNAFQDAVNAYVELDCHIHDHLNELRRARRKHTRNRVMICVWWFVSLLITGAVGLFIRELYSYVMATVSVKN